MRVIVVGAGSLGCAAARSLAESGHDVTVLDRAHIASGTTGLAAGLLSLGLFDVEDQALTQWSIDAFSSLEKAEGGPRSEAEALLHRPGGHLLVGPDAARQALLGIQAGLDILGIPHESHDAAGWQRLMRDRGVQVQTDGVGTVLSIERDAWALSTEGTQMLWRAAKAAGARLVPQRAAHRLLRRGDAVVGVTDDKGRQWDADAVVVAMGAWTRDWLQASGLVLPARAFRTHACVLRTGLARHLPILHDEPGGYYLRPEGPHHVLVGNGTRTTDTPVADFDTTAEDDFVPDVAARLVDRLPGLADAGLQNAWRGLLTGTPDRHPLVGAHPDAPGLWLCVGGNGIGFMRSPALGACLAAAVDGTGPPEDLPRHILDWLDPHRFWPDPPLQFPIREGFRIDPPHGRT